MPQIVGVKLRFAGKTLSFDADSYELAEGDAVVVSTSRGLEFGFVAIPPHEVSASEVPGELKPVLRPATEQDWATYEELQAQEDAARPIFRRMVAERGLDMKPLFAEWMFDRSKLVFYFVSEERVDFRDLVKDLATEFKTRIEMRQIGVRDEARTIGGYSHCGEQLCCARFAGDFQPVSIRMAKEQDLPLNPTKISGVCGRLMCCLRYEFEAYKDFKQRAPKKNAIIDTPQGPGKVVEFNTPREMLTLRTEEGPLKVPLAALDCGKTEEGCSCPCRVTAESLAAFAPKEVSSSMLGDASQLKQAEQMVHPEATAEEKAGKQRRGRKRRGDKKPEGGGEAKDGAAAGPSRPEKPAGEGGPQKRPRRRRGGRGRGSGEKPSAGGAPATGPASGSAGSASGSASGSGAQAGGTAPSGDGEGRRRRRRSHGSSDGAAPAAPSGPSQ